MKRAILALACIWAARVGAQDASELRQSGLAKLGEGRLDDAAHLLERSAAMWAATAPQSRDLAITYQALGTAYYRQQLYRKAERAYTSALTIPGSPIRAVELLTDLAAVYESEHRLADAGEAFTRARELLADAPDAPPLSKATLLSGTANLYMKQGRAPEAEGLYRQAINLVEAAGDPGGTIAIPLLHNLALWCAHRRQYREAIEMFRRAEYRIGAGTALSRAEVLQVLGDYAECLRKAGDKLEARRVTAQARDLAVEAPTGFRGLVVDVSQLRR